MSTPPAWRLLVCVNRRLGDRSPSCAGRGSERLVALLVERLATRGLDLPVETILCFGACSRGPNVRLAPGGAFFHEVDEAALDALVDAVAETVAAGPPATESRVLD